MVFNYATVMTFIRRMINILYLRQQPICENFDRKEFMFIDYKDDEREEIIRE